MRNFYFWPPQIQIRSNFIPETSLKEDQSIFFDKNCYSDHTIKNIHSVERSEFKMYIYNL